MTRTGLLRQELTADGRYDETRGGRTHAHQGRFWIDGDRVDDLDDLGFRRTGGTKGDELHHAGHVMKRG
ncbi:Atu4866 domain-containing protein [Streptomyces sp. OS603R]|uniref:Atu4866 domain-containing protein n=1 Tax=Streptomyces sp. OS603R TaxID=3035287 RepID=UPI002435A3B5|nr:Atu4866 domain-containing protein [Streptomyces sp. OS603R]